MEGGEGEEAEMPAHPSPPAQERSEDGGEDFFSAKSCVGAAELS